MTTKNKFFLAQPWLREVLEAVKRELKTEHLPGHPAFCNTHFPRQPLRRIGAEEMLAVYEKVLVAGDVELGDWIVSRWVCKQADLYGHFAERLSQISENFSQLEILTEEQSRQVLEGAAEQFGAIPVYLFALLNGVVFPETVFNHLRKAAEAEKTKRIEEESKQEESTAPQQVEREIARLKERYEAKLAGLEKKYQIDMEGFKKQIRSLQRQLVGRPAGE
jgi:hypothetical protein